MAIRMVITPTGGDTTQTLARVFASVRRNATDARRWLGQIGLYVRREAQRRLRTREKEWGPQSGRLSRSLAMAVEASSVAVGSNLAYAAIQQLGGTVAPKGHRYLALPVPANLRRRGVWPRDLPGDSMRFVPNAHIRIGTRTWTGPALVRAANGTAPGTSRADGTPGKARIAKRSGEVMFALVKRVRIKGRPYLMFDSKAQAFAMAAATKVFSRALGKRGGSGSAGQ